MSDKKELRFLIFSRKYMCNSITVDSCYIIKKSMLHSMLEKEY